MVKGEVLPTGVLIRSHLTNEATPHRAVTLPQVLSRRPIAIRRQIRRSSAAIPSSSLLGAPIGAPSRGVVAIADQRGPR